MIEPSPSAREALAQIARAALAAVDARNAVAAALEREGLRREIAGASELRVLAIGKAAAAMARGVLDTDWPVPVRGLVITKDGHAAGYDLAGFEVVESAHPVPDARSERAGSRALEWASQAAPDAFLLVLLSGGASALITCPPEGLRLEDLARLNRALLGAAVAIDEMNAVRKHVSRVSGGRLARAANARQIHVLAVSDVPGDDLGVIGSGPCAPDPTSFAEALGIVDHSLAGHDVPEPVLAYLQAGSRGDVPETPKAGDPSFERVTHEIVACNRDARSAAARAAASLGARGIELGERLEGEARDLGRRVASLARGAMTSQPHCLIVGGETVVTLRGNGRGGRNQELALAAALGLEGSDITLLALGTDGTDGPTDAAGAFADGTTCARAREAGLDPDAALVGNDAYPLFDPLGDLHRTGPTGTNVMDLLLIWLPAARS